jgi:hypothetical protein
VSGACVLDHGDQRGEAVDGLLLCPRHLRQLTDDCTEIGLLIVDTQRITDGGAPAENVAADAEAEAGRPARTGGYLTLIAMYDERTSATRLPGTRRTDGDQSRAVGERAGTVGSWLLADRGGAAVDGGSAPVGVGAARPHQAAR